MERLQHAERRGRFTFGCVAYRHLLGMLAQGHGLTKGSKEARMGRTAAIPLPSQRPIASA
eukprot:1181408-Prorocentrum_minimum.AAC.2